MTEKMKYNILYFCALLCAVWFLLTSWVWTYYSNLFLSLPFGLLSLILWNAGRQKDENKARYRSLIFILAAGVVASLVSLAVFLATNS